MKRILFYSATLYSIGLTSWYLLNLTLGDAFWWLTILNNAVPIQFIPLPFLLVAAIYKRRWRWVTLSMVLFVVFGWMQAPYLAPIFPAPGTSHDLRVMTYNVLKSNEEYDAVAEVIRSMHPDLIGLQEVEEAMYHALQSKLADLYPYSTVAQLPEWQWNTTVIFSRYPILSTETLDLKEIRPAALVHVEVDGRTGLSKSAIRMK